MGAGQKQFPALFVVQVDIGLDAAERRRQIIYDFVDQPVEVKDRADLLRRLLQLQQILDLAGSQLVGGWMFGRNHSGDGRHGCLS